ncbi:LLM class flavin-dependent oxidoreductase [Nonomuraea sp. NN258]|uniref:LLM class flavin-dependent oxidoreductase n=1 Tax=Nonomuraea antri TaxID=2730852 RepID=UPI00156938D7|nr:LLM class flavin-dependent oxidoreductase [Nonomuraea antri]NRQ33357.1 LLM class flavin-dependent oxidoreductase [Nonomuraea antri]
MRFSLNLPNFGDFADPRRVAEVATAAEEAGWDGVFVWDHLTYRKSEGRALADPWILLAAAGMVTDRILLGPLVTPVARRRPGKLARELVTLDHLTGGRTVFGAGLGSILDDEFGSFGEPTDPKVLAQRLDEGLEAVDLLCSGEQVSYQGTHVTMDEVRFLPRPVQRPRIPVWIAGRWPNKAPFRRAARWDGAVPLFEGYQTQRPPSPGDVGALADLLRGLRTAEGRESEPFDLVVGGETTPGDRGLVADLAAAGATWWDERMPFDERLDQVEPYLRRIELGPPR